MAETGWLEPVEGNYDLTLAVRSSLGYYTLQSGASAQRVGSWRAGSSEGICEGSEIYVPTWIGGGCARARASGNGRVASRIFARVGPGEAVVGVVKPTKSCPT